MPSHTEHDPYHELDTALRTFRNSGPELRNGAPNHGPMVAEALIALGRHDLVQDWVKMYRPHLVEGPRTDANLDGLWSEALGDSGKLGAWQALFCRELAAADWPTVLDKWLPRLIPGTMAAGTHGIIRVGHAVRALQNQCTILRLEELASALAYCAARYTTLSEPPQIAGQLDIMSAVESLPLLSPTVDRSGPPPKVVMHLRGRSDFAAAIQQLAPQPDPYAALGQLCEIGARLYLAGADHHPLVLLHTVTGPAAAQLVIRHISPETGSIVFSYVWQAFAAWAAAFGRGRPKDVPARAGASWDDITQRTAESGDEHAIKLTEACLRLEALNPSPVFRAAAEDWVGRVFKGRGWGPNDLVSAGMRQRLP